MRNKIIFIISLLGLIAGVVSAYLYGRQPAPLPPVFNPAPNPYAKGIYANGIVESYQSNGANINLYPEVSGTIARILVAEGDSVHQGTPLLMLDETIQKATVEQQQAQADAAFATLAALKAQPRKETLAVAAAQVEMASASLKSVQVQLDKQQRSYNMDPESVSRDALDNAINAVNVAQANLHAVQRQYELTKAGAWSYDIKTQEQQYNALVKALLVSKAPLAKYTLTAPVDGVVLSVNATVGSYISPQGAYDPYIQGLSPVLVMGNAQNYLAVRCYIDEILIHRLPPVAHMRAQMFIRGTNISIPLEYVRVQPYVSPKIQLSNQRAERVDLRVLPVIFKFAKPQEIEVYPGQLVDVYVGET